MALLEVTLQALHTIAPPLLIDADTQADTVDTLLNRIALCDDEKEIKAVLDLICLHSTPTPLTTEGLLNVITLIPNPLLIVEVIPQLCGNTPAEIEVVMQAFRDLVNRDRSFLVPVLGALGQLHLPTHIAANVFDIACESISIIDESDVSAVIKCILQTLAGRWHTPQAEVFLTTLRLESARFSPSTLVLVLGLMQDSVRFNAPAARCLLRSAVSRARNL
jgi:hypothetical protein